MQATSTPPQRLLAVVEWRPGPRTAAWDAFWRLLLAQAASLADRDDLRGGR
jgi:hypothetical protein